MYPVLPTETPHTSEGLHILAELDHQHADKKRPEETGRPGVSVTR